MKAEPVRKNKFLRELQDEEGQYYGEEGGAEGEKDKDTAMEGEGVRRKGKKEGEEETYSLDGEVNFWSDYLYSRYHPKVSFWLIFAVQILFEYPDFRTHTYRVYRR